MKILTFTGPVPSTTADKAIMFYKGSITGGTTNAKGFMTNRKSRSPSYRAMDNWVTNADNIFHSLPPGPPTTPATQAAWQAASDSNAGWIVCACTESTPDGQTFFRCYNLLRQFLNLPMELTAPTGPTFTPITVATLTYEYWPAFPTVNLTFDSGGPNLETGWLVFNLGMGLSNPLFDIVGGSPVYHDLTYNRDFLELVAKAKPGPLNFCSWKQDGTPSICADLQYIRTIP